MIRSLEQGFHRLRMCAQWAPSLLYFPWHVGHSIGRGRLARPAGPCGIDLGNGAILEPEDVLETHYQRLAQSRRAAPPRTHTVPVQVGDNLLSAITVLAPGLAPLTELAEDVAQAVSPVQPGQEFRTSLHHALEQTHRQHAAQRVLGTRADKDAYFPWVANRVLTASAALLLLGVFLLGLWALLNKPGASTQPVTGSDERA
jgi:hypothetical protein